LVLLPIVETRAMKFSLLSVLVPALFGQASDGLRLGRFAVEIVFFDARAA
jgi:hypothetical protein